jgi:histone arginine demethylase JMJD6
METAKKLKLKSSRFYEKEMSSKTVELIEEIKLKDRSHLKLKEWYKRNHFDKSMKDIRK